MRALLFSTLFSLSISFSFSESQPSSKTYEVAGTMKGVQVQLTQIKRAPENRLVVTVRYLATSQAPRVTELSVPVPIPPGTTQEEIESGAFNPVPLSLEQSTMVDDQTGEKYPVILRDIHSGAYAPTRVSTSIAPGSYRNLGVEFPIPPKSGNDAADKAKTLSFSFPATVGPITNVPIPPEVPPAAPAAAGTTK